MAPRTFIMSIQSNHFCWHGISTDVNQGTSFYPNVLGWNVDAPAEGQPTFAAPGGEVAHLQAPEGGPPAWCSYLSVDDLDASTARAAEQGGAVLLPPTPLPVGRFSIVTTPSGAVFGLYEPGASDEMAQPGPGSVHWVELQSTAADADVAWLQSVFGFSVRTQQMAQGPYRSLELDGAPRGGVVAAQGDVSAFVAWVQVDDLDATLERVGTHGGRALSEVMSDPQVGRMAVVCDPAGAAFGLVQPS